jgi:hypothetical protein
MIMKHFEDIWNEAEDVFGTMIESGQANGIDNPMVGLILKTDHDVPTATKLVGDILWYLCAYCKLMEKEGKVINSAAALQGIIDTRKAEILDPDD